MADDLRLQKLLDITRQMAEMRALDPAARALWSKWRSTCLGPSWGM